MKAATGVQISSLPHPDETTLGKVGAAAAQSETLWREMLDGMETSVCVLNGDGVVVATNRACLDFFQIENGVTDFSMVAVGSNFIQACSRSEFETSANTLAEGVRDVLNGKRARFSTEYLSAHQAGKQWSHARVVGLSGDGKTRALVSFEDITLLKRSQHLLALEKKILELLAEDRSVEKILATLCYDLEAISDGGRYCICLASSAGHQLRLGAAPSIPDALLEGLIDVSPGEGFGSSAAAILREQPVYCEDIKVDPVWENVREIALSHGLRSCRSEPVFDHSGMPLGVASVYFNDCRPDSGSERELLEHASHLTGLILERTGARDQTRVLSQVFASTQDGIVITDTDNTILMVNQAFTKITGHTAESVVGTATRVFNLHVNPESVQKSLWDGVRTKGYWHGELWDQRKNGDFFYEHLSIRAVKDGQDRTTHFVATFADLSEHKQQGEALRASETMLRLITDSIPALIGYFDSDTRCQFANSGLVRFLNVSDPAFSEAGVAARHLRDMLEESTFTEIEESIRCVLSGSPARTEVLIRSGDAERHFDLNLVPDSGPTGSVAGFYLLASDITEKKQTEEQIRLMNTNLEHRVEHRTQQLAIANRELDAFSYSVSHDLRAPLRTIEGFSRIISSRYADQLDEAGQDYLTRIARATTRMGELIDDMLKLARVSRSEVNKQTVNVTDMVREVCSELPVHPQTDSIRFEIAEHMTIRSDHRLLKICLENLLGNAWKFTGRTPKPCIEIGPVNDAPRGSFYVRDNGAGFDMRYADKLFGVFQRLHSEADFEGTGIGLAIVQRIALLHGWSVQAEGTVDKGACFTVISQTN